MFYLTVALRFRVQLSDGDVERVAFPASPGRDVSVLWCAVHSAEGIARSAPAVRTLLIFLDCVVGKSAFQLQPPPRNMFYQHGETNRTRTAEAAELLETRRREDKFYLLISCCTTYLPLKSYIWELYYSYSTFLVDFLKKEKDKILKYKRFFPRRQMERITMYLGSYLSLSPLLPLFLWIYISVWFASFLSPKSWP